MASTTSSRSQPVRQARTNPVRRPAQTTSKPGSKNGTAATASDSPAVAPVQYAGIHAFTDALEALPMEIVRNFTLLREIDAKAYHPEQKLRQFISAVPELPALPHDQHDPALQFLQQQEHFRRIRDEAFRTGANPPQEVELIHENPHEYVNQLPSTRRSKLHQVRSTVADLLPTMDEKIHVITTTCEALNKHIARLEDAFAVVNKEIPDIHRIGNLEHWGYKPIPPRGTLAARAAAEKAAAAAAAAREQEQEAARNGKRTAAQDDEEVPLSKRVHANNRSKKEEANVQRGHAGGEQKKKKTVTGPAQGDKGKAASSPRGGTPAPSQQKRAKPASTARRRPTAQNSAAASPVMASSPVVSNFSIQKDAAPSPHNLATAISAATSEAPLNAPVKPTAKKVEKETEKPAGKDTAEKSTETKETSKAKAASSAPNAPAVGAPSKSTKPPSRPTSRAATPPAPTSIAPISPTKRKRSPPTKPTPASPRHISPKKSVPTPPGDETLDAESLPEEPDPADDEADDEPDPNEPRYCYCNNVSYGQMVACDGENCRYEWFHLPCLGLTKVPNKSRWYCRDCSKAMGRGEEEKKRRK